MLRGHHRIVSCLDFSPDDSNILVSADCCAIKLWNVEQEVCIYTFNHSCGSVRSLCFPAVDEGNKCIFVASNGSLIRTCWNDLSAITSDIVQMPGLGEVGASTFSHRGSLLAAVCPTGLTLILYSMRQMEVVHGLIRPSLSVPSVLVFSPDDKTLVLDHDRNQIQIYDVHDLKISTPARLEQTAAWAVAFDPSSQFLASAGLDQNIRLWTL
jgi:WD40 repeat protein